MNYAEKKLTNFMRGCRGKKISDCKKLQGFSLANIIMIKINKTHYTKFNI